MNIAVTGASGSIARDLIPFLKHLGHTVIRISTSIPNNGDCDYSYDDLRSGSINHDIDIAFHLASFNSKLDKKNFNREIALTLDLLNALQSIQCKKLIFFSTCKIYGSPGLTKKNFSEGSSLNPQCEYSKAKLQCEDFIKTKSDFLDVDSIILRLPPILNTSKASYIGKLLALSKTKIPFFSFVEGETNKRSFISLNNLQLVVSQILANPDVIRGSKIYNLADKNHISLNNLLRAHSSKRIFLFPGYMSKIFQLSSLTNQLFLRIFGNFEINSSAIENDLGLKLETTYNSLPFMNQKG
jgi:nucleoside-diphosphate-sugar epimerase